MGEANSLAEKGCTQSDLSDYTGDLMKSKRKIKEKKISHIQIVLSIQVIIFTCLTTRLKNNISVYFKFVYLYNNYYFI